MNPDNLEISNLIQEVRKHGGARPGAGRKSKGKTDKVSVTLPAHEWAKIDELIKSGKVASRSDYFRSIHMQSSMDDMLLFLKSNGGGQDDFDILKQLLDKEISGLKRDLGLRR